MYTNVGFTIAELKQLGIELIINHTDKVSDVGVDSVLNGIVFGQSKIAQKALKDIAIVESQSYPKSAEGIYLDQVAIKYGVTPRRGAIGSTTYVLVKASVGTQYVAGINTFKNTNGVSFELTEDFTVGSSGFGYIPVRSVDTGKKTNVDARSIITVTPIPFGHKAVTNEYMSTGGIDSEDDEVFRIRILYSKNLTAKTVIQYLVQILQSFDDKILTILNTGRDDNGVQLFSIINQNGVSFTQNELDSLLTQIAPYLSLTDISKYGDVLGVKLQNVEWYEVGGGVGVDFRVEFDPTYNFDDVRKDIQINLSKKLDFRFWKQGSKVQWDELLETVKNTNGVRYVPDEYFFPKQDEFVPFGKLPRIKSFKLRNLDGGVIFDTLGVLTPIFYPNN